MPPESHKDLSRRERQIIDVLYQHAEASAHDVRAAMEDAPSYSTVRALLARMVEKGLVAHRMEAGKYLYCVKASKTEAQQTALQRLLKTFFDGSAAKAVSALLGTQGNELTEEEITLLEAEIQKAKGKTQK